VLLSDFIEGGLRWEQWAAVKQGQIAQLSFNEKQMQFLQFSIFVAILVGFVSVQTVQAQRLDFAALYEELNLQEL
jgi:hypothetical protein